METNEIILPYEKHLSKRGIFIMTILRLTDFKYLIYYFLIKNATGKFVASQRTNRKSIPFKWQPTKRSI